MRSDGFSRQVPLRTGQGVNKVRMADNRIAFREYLSSENLYAWYTRQDVCYIDLARAAASLVLVDVLLKPPDCLLYVIYLSQVSKQGFVT